MVRINFRIIFDQKSKVNKLQKRIEELKKKEKKFALLVEEYGISCKTCQNDECLKAGVGGACFCLDFKK